jgi:hypothetical protein
MNVPMPTLTTLALSCVAAVLLAAAPPSSAASARGPVGDRAGDFLATYTGPREADLDAINAEVAINMLTQRVTMTATLNGPIDTQSNKLYVFGIDRGRGTLGRDQIFQGPLGAPNPGDPKIGAGVLFDAAVGVAADGSVVFFDALKPGVVPVPGAKGDIDGAEISVTLPLAMFPSQGFEPKDYRFNFWPRSAISLDNRVVSDFLPDDRDAPVTLSDAFEFDMIRPGNLLASCVPDARSHVSIERKGAVEEMKVGVAGLPPKTTFDFFVIQVPHPPFGLSWYQGDIRTDEYGRAKQKFLGRFSAESFSVAPGVQPAPVVHAGLDALSNPATAPLHQFHLGLWFDSVDDAVRAGCAPIVTPFNGEHRAGLQVLNTANFADLEGPLSKVKP